MEPLHFACPHCGLRLRVKDPLSVGRDARCPECHGGFRVELVQGTYRVVAAEPAASAGDVEAPSAAHPQKAPGTKRQPATIAANSAAGGPARRQSPIRPWWQQPAVVGVGIIAVCAVAGIASIYRSQTDDVLPRRDLADSPTSANEIQSAEALPTEPGSEPGTLPAPSDDTGIAAVASGEDPSDADNQGTSDVATISPRQGQELPHEELAIDPQDDQPLEPEFAEEPVGIRQVNIAASLQQRIRRFELSPPRPLRELLPGLEELLGAPIRFDRDEVTDAYLGRGVQLRTENSTVGEILDKLLKEAGLGYEPAVDHLWLKPRG